MKQKSGFAFILALFILLFISLLFIAMFNLLTTEWLITRNQESDAEALYIAEAGIEDGVNNLRLNKNWTAPAPGVPVVFPADSGNSYVVTTTGTPATAISSVATLANGDSKTIVAQVAITGSAPYYTVDITTWTEQ